MNKVFNTAYTVNVYWRETPDESLCDIYRNVVKHTIHGSLLSIRQMTGGAPLDSIINLNSTQLVQFVAQGE